MEQSWFYTMDETGETPMSRAQRSGHRALASILLRLERQHAPDERRSPPKLHHAAYWGLSDIAQKLLAGGADPDTRDAQGTPAIHEAARNGHRETVETLLEHGAKANERDENGMTTLHWLALNGREDLAEMVIEGGADINARAEGLDSMTPREMALLMGYDGMVELLGSRGGIH